MARPTQAAQVSADLIESSPADGSPCLPLGPFFETTAVPPQWILAISEKVTASSSRQVVIRMEGQVLAAHSTLMIDAAARRARSSNGVLILTRLTLRRII